MNRVILASTLTILAITLAGCVLQPSRYDEPVSTPMMRPKPTTPPTLAIKGGGNETGCLTVTASVLNMRSGPSIAYQVISWLHYGETLAAIRATGNGWWLVSADGVTGYVTGYVNGKYTRRCNNGPEK